MKDLVRTAQELPLLSDSDIALPKRITSMNLLALHFGREHEDTPLL